MGGGFWIIQATFVVAAIATAVHVERVRRRDEQDAPKAPHVHIPIVPSAGSRASEYGPRSAGTAKRDMSTASHGSPQFTMLEEYRLLILRGTIRQARLYRGRLYDDLAPDETDSASTEDRQTPPAATPGPSTRSSGPPLHRWTSLKIALLAAGVVLTMLGAAGIWLTNAHMDDLERAPQGPAAVQKTSLMTHLLPGLLANPAKYLSAVNSAGSSSGSLTTMALLELRRAMDRYEAVLGIAVALLVGSATNWPTRTQQPAGSAEGAQESSIATDVVPFIVVVALLCAALSFFELP